MSAEADVPIERILVIALDRLGDTLQSVPTMQAVRERFLDARIDLLAVATNAPALDGSPFHDRYLALPAEDVVAFGRVADRWQAGETVSSAGLAELADVLRGERYDLVVNLGTSTLGAWLTTVSGPRFNVGLYVGPDRALLVEGAGIRYFVALLDFRDENPFNLADMWRASIAEPRIPSRPRAFVARSSASPIEGGPRVVALNPGASRADRRWPLSSFVRLADLLGAEGLEVALVGSPQDAPLCDAVARASVSRPRVVTNLSVPEMAAWFSAIGCVVSNDTGAMHVAAGVGARAVGIYGGFARCRETGPFAGDQLLIEGRELSDVDAESVAMAVRIQLGLVDDATACAHWRTRSIDVLRSRIDEDSPAALGGVRCDVLAHREPSEDELRSAIVRALALATYPPRWIGRPVEAAALREAVAGFPAGELRRELGEALLRWGEALEVTAKRWRTTTADEGVLDEQIAVLLKVEAMNVGQILGDGIAMLSRLLEWDLKMIVFDAPSSFGERRAERLDDTATLARDWAAALLAGS